MIAPTIAFRAELTRFDFASGTFQVTATLPSSDWDAFSKAIGRPSPPNDGDPAAVRSVALLACRTPRYPDGDTDVLAAAGARTLIHALQRGDFRLSPEMLGLLGMISGLMNKHRVYAPAVRAAPGAGGVPGADHGL